ncbi:MAG: TolC family protein [Spirochaetes bacterium]|nr:TolC family protein [Spirochaetota bacterium]
MHKYFLLIISVYILSICLANDLKAEEILTWSDCVRIAGVNHPELQSAAEKTEQSKANIGITRSTMLPQIDANAGVSRSKTSTESARTDGTTNSYSYGITGKQLLFDSAKSLYDIKSSQKQLEALNYDYQTASSTVRLSLRKAFIQLLRAQELLGISKEIAAIRKKNFELVQMRYRAGVENKGSLLTAEANMAQSEHEVSQAERSVSLAQHSLIKEMGLMDFRPLKAKGDFSVKTEKDKPDIAGLANINPSVRKIVSQREAADYDIKSAKLDNSPKIYGQLSANRTGTQWPPQNSELSAGLQMSFNLFEGGKSYYEVSKSHAAYNQLTADEKSTRGTIMLNLEQKWNTLENNMTLVSVQSKFLKAAEERAVIADAQYSIGSIVFDNWIIIQDALVNAKKNFLDAEANALSAEAEWIQAKGGTLIYGE